MHHLIVRSLPKVAGLLPRNQTGSVRRGNRGSARRASYCLRDCQCTGKPTAIEAFGRGGLFDLADDQTSPALCQRLFKWKPGTCSQALCFFSPLRSSGSRSFIFLHTRPRSVLREYPEPSFPVRCRSTRFCAALSCACRCSCANSAADTNPAIDKLFQSSCS